LLDRLTTDFQAGRYRELVQVCEQELQPAQDPLAAQVLAAALFQLSQYEQAAAVLAELEGALGDLADYLSLYGATCRRLGRLDRARELLARAYRVDPASKAIRNNYANLLIDLGELQQARLLLEALLQEDPDFRDARVNLNRLEFHRQSHQVDPQPAPSAPSRSASWLPNDPLMLAFSDSEVQRTRQDVKLDPEGVRVAARLPSPQSQEMASEQLTMAARAIQQSNPQFALDLCSQAHAGLGPNSLVYTNAADAYINLQRFHEAEICLLHALALGAGTVSTYINLISLASMRADFALADHYLNAAAALDPQNPQLQQVKANLQQRRASLPQAGYRFEPSWPLPELRRQA